MAGRQLTAAEAAERLGVKPATLYAYVSRGVLSRTRTSSGSRFDAAEIERLARGSRKASRGGELTLVTELTLIDDGSYRYRGLDAVALSRTRRFEEVACWLWDGRWPEPSEPWQAPPGILGAASRACTGLGDSCTPAERWRVAVAAAATADPLRHDRTPSSVTKLARGLLAALVELLPLVGPATARSQEPVPLAARLWPRLSPLPATSERIALLDSALVLMADHEIAASTLAARTAASFGADPYAVALTGMASASGPLHAASSLQVRPVLAQAQAQGPAVALGEKLGRDGALHGFGHSLYPAGDPRATEILARLHATPASLDAVDGLLALAAEREIPPPNCDFALAALAQTALMVPGASEAIFVLARTAGWVAHAIEEYRERSSFRVRASYVGPAS